MILRETFYVEKAKNRANPSIESNLLFEKKLYVKQAAWSSRAKVHYLYLFNHNALWGS